LVQKVLGGYGEPLLGPVPPSVLGAAVPTATSSEDLAALAKQSLIAKGWVEGAGGVLTKTTGKGKTAKTLTLAFDLSTADVPELRAAAQYLKDTWGRMGAQVSVKIFEQGDLAQNVIRPRKFDALLFGEVVGRELDLFAFWHSSQRNDPGLNVSGYANATADKLLEQLRTTPDGADRDALYQKFLAELNKDIPAVFLYAPDFVYSIPKDIKGVDLGLIEQPSDRFLSVAAWHLATDYVWPFLKRFQ
jgi:peptide/nickel transport system substrate-binding protein